MKKSVNGQTIEMSAEETAAREADVIVQQEKDAAGTANYEAIEAQKATDKASAKAKLIAGEALTEAEADTVVI
jgi:hypothetical protein